MLEKRLHRAAFSNSHNFIGEREQLRGNWHCIAQGGEQLRKKLSGINQPLQSWGESSVKQKTHCLLLIKSSQPSRAHPARASGFTCGTPPFHLYIQPLFSLLPSEFQSLQPDLHLSLAHIPLSVQSSHLLLSAPHKDAATQKRKCLQRKPSKKKRSC